MKVNNINWQGKHLSSAIQHIKNSAVKSSNSIVPSKSSFIYCPSVINKKLGINNAPMCTNQQFNGLVTKDRR